MKRHNAFYLIHKALRAMLYDAALTLQQTDFAVEAEASSALAKIDSVLSAFDNHARHEDRFIIPAVETYEPGLAASFEAAHSEDHRIANRLKNLITIFDHTLFPEERQVCGSAIIKAFTDFVVFNIEHMAKEEMLLNQALWRHYTDEQLTAIQQRLQSSIPAAEMEKTSKWMFRSISTTDAVNWLRAAKISAPENVFNNLMSVAQEELSELRFASIQEILEAQTAAA